jgi:hypothetical protein
MKADDILKKHEDDNEMHFHEVDRKWIIEAMEEYAALRQPLVVGRSEQLLAVSDLKDFAYEVCPLHREDDLQEIISRL